MMTATSAAKLPAAFLLLVFSTMSVCDAWTTPLTLTKIRWSTAAKISSTVRTPLTQLYSSTDEQVAALRAAAQKAREDAARLSEELGRGSDTPASQASSSKIVKRLSRAEIESLLSTVDFSDAPSQVAILEQIGGLWKSANLRTFPVSLNMMTSRSNGVLTSASMGFDSSSTNVNLDDFKYATIGVTLGSGALAVASLAFLPENIGAAFCYFFALVPILFLGLGSSVPGVIADTISRIRNRDTASTSGDDCLDRICRHEAAHFLCGYLCGLPVCEYSVTPQSVPSVTFHPTRQGPATRAYSSEEIAALSIVSLSGSVAEVIQYGNCQGATNDLVELQNFFRRSSEFIGTQREQDLTRWGALTAYQLLVANKGKLDALVAAFRVRNSVAECITIVESTE